ncbi:hypothetical protein [Clostridium phage Amboise]|nr:hypothetical protein [Clostridium phage Amboise]DAH78961.1 MAG TPA: hypothetical protein [Caudoviricetes sp.]
MGTPKRSHRSCLMTRPSFFYSSKGLFFVYCIFFSVDI